MSTERKLLLSLAALAITLFLAAGAWWLTEQDAAQKVNEVVRPPVQHSEDKPSAGPLVITPVTVAWACEQPNFKARSVSCTEDANHLYIPMYALEQALSMVGRLSHRDDGGWQLRHWQKGESNITVTNTAFFRVGKQPYVELWNLPAALSDSLPHHEIRVSGLPVTTYQVSGGEIVVHNRRDRGALWGICDVAFGALEEYEPSDYESAAWHEDEDRKFYGYYVDRECTLNETPQHSSFRPVQTELMAGEAVLLVYRDIMHRRAYPAKVGEGGVVHLPLPDHVEFVDNLELVGLSPSDGTKGERMALFQVTNLPLSQLREHVVIPSK